MSLSKIFASAAFAGYVLAVEPNPPTWDTARVKVFSPSMSQGDAQAIIDTILKENGGHEPKWNGQWSNDRYALLFEAGTHDLNVEIGYYTTVHGLGRTPLDTTLNNLMVQNGAFDMVGGALANFWRGAENVRVPQNMLWAVSQAAPLRRIHVDGDLQTYQYNPPFPGAGYASGGYMSDINVTGALNMGSQQQFFVRNTNITGFQGGVWNYVFVGSNGAPDSHCSNVDGPPVTNVAVTPVIVEKPYIVADGQSYKLMRPKVEFNKKGTTPNWVNADEIDFSDVYVANENDSAAKINAKLAEGLHLLFQPGNYHLEDSIKVNNANTVVMGMGLATLIPTNGTPAIEVSNVDGVRVAGLLLEAGSVNSQALLLWGQQGYAGSSSNPGAISDVYARVGGTNPTGDRSATNMIQVESGNVIIDDIWLWRADHDIQGLVYNSRNPVDTGLLVNGDNVTGYGLACEHTLKDLLVWNGDNGKSYFYQSEFPYDVTQANYGDKGYVGFRIGDNVNNHQGFGLGAYSFFRDNDVTVNTGIHAPVKSGITLTNSLNVFLDGKGRINHVVDDEGGSVNAAGQQKWDCNFVGSAQSKAENFLQ